MNFQYLSSLSPSIAQENAVNLTKWTKLVYFNTITLTINTVFKMIYYGNQNFFVGQWKAINRFVYKAQTDGSSIDGN